MSALPTAMAATWYWLASQRLRGHAVKNDKGWSLSHYVARATMISLAGGSSGRTRVRAMALRNLVELDLIERKGAA